MRKVITYGTFDTFHFGHFFLLERAKKFGDYLIVGVSSDKFNESKGKAALIDFDTRKRIISSLSFVDKVITEQSWDQKIRDIQRLNVNVFVMGNDWQGKFDELGRYCSVEYLERTPRISSTQIRSGVNAHSD